MKNYSKMRLRILAVFFLILTISCEKDDSIFYPEMDTNAIKEKPLVNSNFVAKRTFMQISLGSINNLCPNTRDAELFEGSTEFRGPVKVTRLVKLYIDHCDGSQDKIKSRVYIYMKGVNSNTKLKQSWVQTHYTAPQGKRIGSIWDPDNQRWSTYSIGYSYSDKAQADRFDEFDQTLPEAGWEGPFWCNDGNSYKLTNKYLFETNFNIIADTGKDDISVDRNCHCDSKINNITLNNVVISLEEPYEYIGTGSYRVSNRHSKNYLKQNGNTATVGNYDVLSDWIFERVNNTKYYRIKSKKHQTYLHAEYGRPELLENVPIGWHSAMWELEPVEAFSGPCRITYFRIRCRHRGLYLHTQYGPLWLMQNVPKGWYSAMWSISDLIY